MTPRFLPVTRCVRETADVVTLELATADGAVLPGGFKPGQFNMLYAFGVGEAAISISGDPADSGRLLHSIRAVGPVSRALSELESGQSLGVRGPFGVGWPVEAAEGRDVLVLAGGVGLAPLRPVLYHLLRHRSRYGRVSLLYGARNPAELLFRSELDAWRRSPDIDVRVTVDSADHNWAGDVGVITGLLRKLRFDPFDSVAMICGPEIMMRVTAHELGVMGLSEEQIYVSMERNMKCAAGFCGHCQFGPHFVCRDGPVFTYDRVADIIKLREI